MTDQKGHLIQFGYDTTGALVSERMSAGYSARGRRNARGELTDWSDSQGRQFTFQYDARGALVLITNTTGEWARADRDTTGRVARLSNSHGQSRAFSYDASGALVKWTDALNRTYSVAYDPVNGKASHMTQINGDAKIVRGDHGHAILQLASTTPAASSGAEFEDGWHDPLYGLGLLGAFSGFSRYAVKEAARSPRGTVPAALAATLAANPSYTIIGDDGGDYGGDDGGGGDDYGDDDDGDSDGDGSSPDCQSCEAAYQTTCTSTYNDAMSSAQTIELGAIAACTALIEVPVAYLACLGAAALVYSAQTGTASTAYNNCMILIPQNCYSQCQG